MNTNQTTRLTKWLAHLTALAALAGIHSLHAQTWQTVLDYQLVPGKNAWGWRMAADTLGNVFSGGEGFDTAGIKHGLALKTDTTELAKVDPLTINWLFSDDTNPGANLYSSNLRSLACGGSGRIYSAGWLTPTCSGRNCPGSSWLVRRSLSSGAAGSWTSLDSFQLASGKGAGAYDVFEDSSGNIFACGGAQDTKGNSHGLLRRSVDGGQIWVMVDDVPFSSLLGIHLTPGSGMFTTAQANNWWQVRRGDSGGNNWTTVDKPFAGTARRAASDNTGYVYAVGHANKSTGTGAKNTILYNEWTVRKWKNGDLNWSTDHTFALAQYKSSYAWDVATDTSGKPVVAGSASDAQGILHWIVRRPDSSGVWHTVDDFQFPQGQAEAVGVAVDAAGNLLVSGAGYDSAGTGHWIVRRLAPTAP
ncbi:MAG: hypothetical protein HY043_15230 [Verrucomicrobia bacterium]|nr:hypothetical protein [Verrucomicrobiota bacterium]